MTLRVLTTLDLLLQGPDSPSPLGTVILKEFLRESQGCQNWGKKGGERGLRDVLRSGSDRLVPSSSPPPTLHFASVADSSPGSSGASGIVLYLILSATQ